MRLKSRPQGERGQALIIVVGALTVVFVIGAIAVDVGLWLAERRAAQSVADLSALAASQDLPGDDAQAVANAYAWADKNGYDDGVDGVQVSVALLCSNQLAEPPAGLCANGAGAGPSACASGAGCDAVRVTIQKPAGHLFTSLLGLGDIEVTAGASAVAGISAMSQTTLLLFDASGAMLHDCTRFRDNDGCFIKEGKEAALSLVDVLTAGSVGSLVGYLPYNYCYDNGEFVSPQGAYLCVPTDYVVPPTSDARALRASIENTTARSYVNLCVPLTRAAEMLGAGPQSVVFLTDGDNIAYHDGNWPGVPPACLPASANAASLTRGCRPSTSDQGVELDGKAWQAAQQLKALGAEIYVVGLGVCGRDDGRDASDLGYCAGIGDGAHDDIANQRLLKCIASSPEHYYPVSDPRQLPETFSDIAFTIANRGLLE